MADWKTRPGLNYEGAAIVRVAGMDRFIPLLSMRQNRVVVPLMLKVLPVIEAAGAREVETTDPETGRATKELVMPPPEVTLRLFSEETIEVMTRIVYSALTRAYTLTFDEFLDEAITVHELSLAMPAIVKQTGFFEQPKEARGKRAGEDQAASR